MIVSINPYNPQRRLIRRAVEALKDGGIIVYPTDTSYGIGCSLYSKESIEKIYKMKQRPITSPFSFVCNSLSEISKYCIVTNYAYRVLNRLLPGPYTFILSATKLVPKILVTKRKTVGIRVPRNNVCLELVGELQHPIINTSAALEDPIEIVEKYRSYIDLVLDVGRIPVEFSTIISLINDEPEILRIGKGDVTMFMA